MINSPKFEVGSLVVFRYSQPGNAVYEGIGQEITNSCLEGEDGFRYNLQNIRDDSERLSILEACLQPLRGRYVDPGTGDYQPAAPGWLS
jgi:hypothetical protein